MKPDKERYIDLLVEYNETLEEDILEELEEIWWRLSPEEQDEIEDELNNMYTSSPTRECNQCGQKDWPGWKSDQCTSFPFGSCDGTMVKIKKD
jgi:hypothetical protein